MKNFIAERRKALKMTQPQLAEKVNLTSYTILQAYERGRREPGVSVAIRIAKALNCSVEDLFALDD